MRQSATPQRPGAGARRKLLDASLTLFREQGYTATSVDDLCAAAGVTKGAFFHHFKSKDALAIESASHWTELTGAMFAAAPYHRHADPLERVLGYLDFRRQLLVGSLPEITCLAGTLVQEIYESHPDIARACEASISTHAESLEEDIAAAMKRYRVRGRWTAASLALHTQTVLQGAFVVAKALDSVEFAIDSVSHLRRYIKLLFDKRGREPRSLQ
jgi:TetR/AcrR family transcriptional repressor of nem operon